LTSVNVGETTATSGTIPRPGAGVRKSSVDDLKRIYEERVNAAAAAGIKIGGNSHGKKG
jgi:hypothetical protein